MTLCTFLVSLAQAQDDLQQQSGNDDERYRDSKYVASFEPFEKLLLSDSVMRKPVADNSRKHSIFHECTNYVATVSYLFLTLVA